VNIDPNAIQDLDGARQAIVHLLNLIEDLTADLREAQAEIQRLRDENNRLKGEQGKPDMKPNTKPAAPIREHHSSERERHKPQAWKKSHKVESTFRLIASRSCPWTPRGCRPMPSSKDASR
jgi:hypothetical protein